jgi:hypothetical protein
MTTGLAPSDARFQARWSDFLRELGQRLQPAAASAEPTEPESTSTQ